MALVIETGTGAANSQAYADAAAYVAWATAYNGTAPTATTAEIEGAILRSVAYLNTLKWHGSRTNGRAQALAWPRQDVTDCEGNEIASNEIPAELIQAQHVLTEAELASPGITAPNGNFSRIVKREKVDVIEREYDTARATGTDADFRTMITGALDLLRCFAVLPGGPRQPWAVVV